MCSVNDILTDIRKSLNECVTVENGGCGCNTRYTDDDIVSAINQGIHKAVSLRPDDFIVDVDITIPAGACRVNICDKCDKFVRLAYSKSEPCFFPKDVCQFQITKKVENMNACLNFDSSNLKNDAVYEYSFSPKSPCTIYVNRECIDKPTEVVIECTNYLDDFAKDDELPELLCKKYRDFIYHQAIYHLIDRDHRPTPEYLQLKREHLESAIIIMRDMNEADRNFHSPNYFGDRVDDCGDGGS